MTPQVEAETCQPDPAAVFACAHSLWEALLKHGEADSGMDLSDCFNGMDELMRKVMRVAKRFEDWACLHVAFSELDKTWPYLLADEFGSACLKVLYPASVSTVDEPDCLRIALVLRLPLKVEGHLPIPIDVRAVNPISDSPFREFRIQTVRTTAEGDAIIPFCLDDEPFDENYGPPYFGIYGIDEAGELEHIADRVTYSDAVALVKKLVPNIAFPGQPAFHGP
jgi:hypothetical protein